MALDEDAIKVGHRIECEGYYATVKFVGKVQGSTGIWLGIEWDDESRGKHDGSKDGVQYFQTSHPTAGSFVRSKKVNRGVSFLEALKERYGRIEGDSAGVVEEELFVMGKGKQTIVEMVGAKSVNLKQSEFKRLKEVILREMLVSHSGPVDAIQSTVPKVTELDISKCLFSSWTVVAEITTQLQHLKSLNVSDNRLSVPDDASVLSRAFQQLKTLFLNRCAYNWYQICKCAAMWPQLETLHACFNNISAICDPLPQLNNIKLLNFESNPIASWEHVKQLGNLPKLETLILNSCDIEAIFFNDVRSVETSQYFQNLKSISLFHNKISKWESINELSKLKNLEDLKFRFNPLTTEYQREEDVRSIAVAKLPKLRKYNRSVVDHEERRGAEVDYLKLYGQQWKKSGGNQDPQKNNPSAEFIDQHPVYQRLVDKHGPPEDSELIKHSTALSNTLIEVIITASNLPDKPALKKKLPGTMTVQKLKGLLQRLYRTGSSTVELTYCSQKMPDQKIKFDNNMREISFYAIEAGDVINVTW